MSVTGSNEGFSPQRYSDYLVSHGWTPCRDSTHPHPWAGTGEVLHPPGSTRTYAPISLTTYAEAVEKGLAPAPVDETIAKAGMDMLRDHLTTAAASLWDRYGFETNPEYLRGQVETIIRALDLDSDNHRADVTAEIEAKVRWQA